MSTAPPEPPRPVARWKLVLGLLVLVSVGLVGWLYIRGTWADATPRNPSSAAEGPVAQLYRPAGENVRVRGAILLDHPIDRVWKEVSDVAPQPGAKPFQGFEGYVLIAQLHSVERGLGDPEAASEQVLRCVAPELQEPLRQPFR